MTTYCHARAAFSEVYHSWVELVLEEVGMSNHCTSQHQTGACHKSGSHHLALQRRENKYIIMDCIQNDMRFRLNQ